MLCPREALGLPTHAGIVRFLHTYVIHAHAYTNHGFKSPDENQLIVSVGVWNRGNLFPATSHDKRVRKPQHVIEHAILRNATRRDPLCGSSNQRLAHSFHIQSVPELLSLWLTADSLITFECAFPREEFQNTITCKLQILKNFLWTKIWK